MLWLVHNEQRRRSRRVRARVDEGPLRSSRQIVKKLHSSRHLPGRRRTFTRVKELVTYL